MDRNILLFAAVFSAVAFSAPTAIEPKEMEHRFVEVVVNGHKFPLDPQMHPGCTKQTRTVGDVYARMMNEFIFGVGTEKQIKISCASFDPASSPFKAPKKDLPIECRIQTDWKNSAGTVEKIGLIARLTKNGKALERKYLSCLLPQ